MLKFAQNRAHAVRMQNSRKIGSVSNAFASASDMYQGCMTLPPEVPRRPISSLRLPEAWSSRNLLLTERCQPRLRIVVSHKGGFRNRLAVFSPPAQICHFRGKMQGFVSCIPLACRCVIAASSPVSRQEGGALDHLSAEMPSAATAGQRNSRSNTKNARLPNRNATTCSKR